MIILLAFWVGQAGGAARDSCGVHIFVRLGEEEGGGSNTSILPTYIIPSIHPLRSSEPNFFYLFPLLFVVSLFPLSNQISILLFLFSFPFLFLFLYFTLNITSIRKKRCYLHPPSYHVHLPWRCSSKLISVKKNLY